MNHYRKFFNFFIDIANTWTGSCEEFHEEIQLLDRESTGSDDQLIARQLSSTIIEYTGKRPLIFVFDDALCLVDEFTTERPNSDPSENYFTLLQEVSRELNKNEFMLVVGPFSKLIKNPNANYNKPDPGARVAKITMKLFPPIYLLPTWNLYYKGQMDIDGDDESLRNKISKPRQAIEFGTVCNFGRPLWGAWNAANNGANLFDLITLATQKLIGGKPETKKELNEEDLLALFSARLSKSIKPTYFEMATELVASNMATLVHISENSEVLQIDYPSEPMLAEAAARLLHHYKDHYHMMVTKLADLIRTRTVSIGDLGELAFEMISLKAQDKAARTSKENNNPPFEYIKFVRVRDFLEALFGKKFNEIEMHTPQRTTRSNSIKPKGNATWRQSMEQVLDGYMYFTHFFYANQDINFGCIKHAVKKGQAIRCKPNAWACDYVFPVVFNLDQDLTDDNITCILVQVKLYSKPINWSGHFAGLKLSVVDEAPRDRAYLSLFVELGEKSTDDKGKLKCYKIGDMSACIYSRSLRVFNCLNDIELQAFKYFIATFPKLHENKQDNKVHHNFYCDTFNWPRQ